MKKFICIMLSLVLTAVLFAGCAPDSGDEPGQEQDEILLLNTTEQTVNSLTAVDRLGREVPAISGSNDERYVGLFYFLWNGQERTKQTQIYDNTVLFEQLGDAFWDGTQIVTSPPSQFHYWGEPLFGYYNAQDPWVIRRHLEMITMAGIDFLVFDATNQFTYNQVWQVMFPIMEEFAEQGFAIPKIVFYTNTESEQRVTQLYSQLYSQGLFKDLWFCPNGKPLIICANKAGCSEEIRNFFDFRSSQWPGTTDYEDGFPWIDFNRPQKVYPKGGVTGGSIMSVSVSQHPGWPFSDSIQYKDVQAASGKTYYNENWGRGYTTEAGVNDPSKIDEGANFQEQWDNAIEADPSTVFVTGWNEWIAVKNFEDITVTTGVPSRVGIPDRRVFFVDTFNEEFSRDIEPMKGGYGDNYYLQMIENIRAYKGYMDGEYAKGQKLTIDTNGSVKQWEAVTSSFRDFVGDAVERNHVDAAGVSTYTDTSNRNDISEIRLTYDNDNIYILVSTAENITAHEQGDLSWMNILIGVDGSDAPAFENWQYVINRTPGDGTTSVERSLGGYSFEEIGDAQYSVNGKYLQVAIPKTLLGLGDNFTLEIKVTDHITHPDDIMDYYVSGDSAPIGRFSYSWQV